MIFGIAWKLREQWEREEEEERERLRKQYDPKERITYTLEQLIEGVRSGRQYLYTLLLEFGSKELLKGRLAVPFNKNFYDESDGTGRDCASCGAESVPFLNISAEQLQVIRLDREEES